MLTRVLRSYRALVSLSEIESSKTLKWLLGASLLSFFATFYSWIGSTALTVDLYQRNGHECWPWFQSCGEWFFLRALPDGYSQTTLYMLLFGIMLLATWAMAEGRWLRAHLLLTVLFVYKTLVVFFLTADLHGNYDYYHLYLTFIVLFLPHKLFFAQFCFVLFYFLSSTIKFHEGWILGTYFTAMRTGLPLFPDSLAPFITNAVIFMQVVGAWFLVFGSRAVRLGVLGYMVFFHLYSGILVEYRYPTTVIPTLLILFGPFYERVAVPCTRRALGGWMLVVFLCVAQFIAVLIPGDQKYTLEGNEYGFYMFEANHQCRSTFEFVYEDGASHTVGEESALARHRCDPYDRWFSLNELCRRDPSIVRIGFIHDHSINGGPFYRIVDIPNACAVSYNAFSRNNWIKIPGEGAPAVGLPRENFYY